MRINIVEAAIRASYGGGAKGLPLDPTLGRVESIVFDQARPGKAMVKIWTGFHDAKEYLENKATVKVLLGVDILRRELTVEKGDYVKVGGVGWLGLISCLTPITKDDSRFLSLIRTLNWAGNNPNHTLLG